MIGNVVAGLTIVVATALIVIAVSAVVLALIAQETLPTLPRVLGLVAGALVVVAIGGVAVRRAARRLLADRPDRPVEAELRAPHFPSSRLIDLDRPRVTVLTSASGQSVAPDLERPAPAMPTSALQALGPQAPPRQPA